MGLRRIALLRDGDMVTVGACRIAVRLMDHAVTGAVLHEHASPPSSGVFMAAEPGDRQTEEPGDTTQSPSVHGAKDFFADATADERHVRPAYPDPAGSWDQPFIASHRRVGEALHGSATDTSLDARTALRALHPTICFDDDDGADGRALALIADAGECIRQAVSGISDLYKADDERGRGLIPRSTLHAIEDNPLRLGQDRDATLRALFSPDRSPVLLSGPAAIQECFAEARRHNLAVVQAIDRSLDVVLGALSPDNLKKRFVRYGVDADLAEGDDARCWHMYGHYHAELAAPRQNGFARLFWDVFDQAYDQAMRAPAVTP
jgi:type VI secretion system FHA domain protein